jgi:hypothetical protein
LVFRATDVAAVPADVEPFGPVIPEAMSPGVSSIATHSGAFRALLRHGEAGLLVPVRDPQKAEEMAQNATPRALPRLAFSRYRAIATRYSRGFSGSWSDGRLAPAERCYGVSEGGTIAPISLRSTAEWRALACGPKRKNGRNFGQAGRYAAWMVLASQSQPVDPTHDAPLSHPGLDRSDLPDGLRRRPRL